MKKLLSVFIILFLSTPCFGEWKKITKNMIGNTTFYLDFETIRKVDGYHYVWMLGDYIKPSKFGDLSVKVYFQVDCKLFRFKILNDIYHTGPMGTGKISHVGTEPEKEWTYPSPGSVNDILFKDLCRF